MPSHKRSLFALPAIWCFARPPPHPFPGCRPRMMCTGNAAGPAALDFPARRASSEEEALRGHRPDMTSSSEQPGSGEAPARRPGGDLFYVPVGWLIFVMAWSVYGLASAWWLVGNSGLPDKIFNFLLGGLVANVIIILWGLYLLGLAFARSG